MTISPQPIRGYLLAVLAAAGWAGGALTAKWLFLTGGEVDAATLSAGRAILATVMLAGYLAVFRREELSIRWRDLPFLAMFGVFGLAMVHFTYFATIRLTSVPTAILLEYLAPILVLLVSVAFLGQRLTWALPAGVLLSVTGCALMVGAIGGEGMRISPAGLAWGLGSAVFFAFYTLLGKLATGRFSPWTLLVYGLGSASVFWLAFQGGPGPVIALLSDPTRASAVTTMAFASTVVPFGAFLAALHHINATEASITATLEPVIAGLGTYVIPALHEPLSGLQLVGGALVLVAVVVSQVPALMQSGRQRTGDGPIVPPAA